MEESNYTPKIIRKWTKEEIEYLKTNLNTMTYNEIGKHMKRSDRQVSQKAMHLGLRKVPAYPDPEKKLERARELYKHYSKSYVNKVLKKEFGFRLNPELFKQLKSELEG